jgi:glycosyltransferase involved in cell wall biosynthesis
VYLKNETNLGIAKTLNKGIEIAKGKYIARIDAGDISLSNRLKEEIKVFSIHKNVDLVYTRAKLLSEEGKIRHLYAFYFGFEATPFILPFTNLIMHPSVMIKSEVLKSFQYRSDKSVLYIEDWDLWLRMLNGGCRFYTIKQPLLLYRLTNTSITFLHSEQQAENGALLLKEYLHQNFPELKVQDDVIKFLAGKKENASYSIYIQAKSFINRYLDAIEQKQSISRACKKDLKYWKNYILSRRGLSVLKRVNSFDKIKVLLQLICISPVFYCNHCIKFIQKYYKANTVK